MLIVRPIGQIIFCGLTDIPRRYMSSRSKIQFSSDNLKAPTPEIQADYFKRLMATSSYVIRIDDRLVLNTGIVIQCPFDIHLGDGRNRFCENTLISLAHNQLSGIS